MREKKDFLTRLTGRLDLPREALPGGFSVLLSGEGEVLVRGCTRILEYGEERIRVCVGKRVLCVEGEALFCASFGAQEMLINGTVRALFLQKEGENAR